MGTPVLALDLERTLISDALTAEPRPGLFDFLTFCLGHFDRVVLFTSVDRTDAWEVLAHLARRGEVPPDLLGRLEYVGWEGEHKDLRFIPGTAPGEVILVDDDPGWVHPEQRDRWVPVQPWDGGADDELVRIRATLDATCRGAGP